MFTLPSLDIKTIAYIAGFLIIAGAIGTFYYKWHVSPIKHRDLTIDELNKVVFNNNITIINLKQTNENTITLLTKCKEDIEVVKFEEQYKVLADDINKDVYDHNFKDFNIDLIRKDIDESNTSIKTDRNTRVNLTF